MARYNDGLIPASPTVVSGVTAFGTHVNPFIAAVLSGFSGTTRSDSATAGQVWSKEVAGGYELNMFVGSATDVPLGTVTTATAQYAIPIDVIEAGLASSGRGAVAGDIKMHGANTAPTGWLKCNGAAVSRTTYADLFAEIGTTWGTGDGSTTFNLPDFRGEFVRGWDDGRGVDSGRAFGSAQAQAIQSHSHDVDVKFSGTGDNGVLFQVASGSGSTIGTQATGGTETRPRNVATLFCIKF
jgi:microcystin-dependent protein